MSPFHYVFKVKVIESTRKFYIDILGCEEGKIKTINRVERTSN